tara:strand:- start:710 stop:979 length:270 start_codon:yes stop_codon:yes gene_type:complete
MSIFIIFCLAYIQNISFTMVSRSRNRDNVSYHAICSVFSNGIWFLTMRELVLAELSFFLIIPYVVGTVAGSLTGQKASIWIEQKIGAKT